MPDSTRRDFLSRGGSALGATWLAMGLPAVISSCEQAWDAVDTAASVSSLSPAEAADLKAIAAQMFPTTDTPGANEAGVIHFLDNAFGSFFKGFLEPIRSRLESVNGKVTELSGTETRFGDLTEDAQHSAMEAITKESYFGLIRFVVTCGMFSHPDHGGNQGKVGWALLGFDDRHGWQPPFGYYDAEANDTSDAG